MKIIVRHKDTEIVVCENEDDTQYSFLSMKWKDQNIQIQETLIVMTEQVMKLHETTS